MDLEKEKEIYAECDDCNVFLWNEIHTPVESFKETCEVTLLTSLESAFSHPLPVQSAFVNIHNILPYWAMAAVFTQLRDSPDSSD